MGLSTDLISQFVKATKDDTKTSKEKTVYGVISSNGSTNFVKLDGASDDTLIPVTSKNSTVDVKDGDRVTVLLKDHKATVTGNLSDPAARVTRIEYVEETVSKVVTTDVLKAEVAEATKLKADKAYVDELSVKMGTAETFIADQLIVNETVTANKGVIDELDTTYAKIAYVDAVKEDVDELNAGVAKIDTLIFGSASGDVIQTDFSNSVIAQVGDAQIKSAMIDTLDASKVKSGSISTNDVTVTSDDGKLVIADETIQIKDSNATVRVQIGKDAENDYSINIWDADGKLMFSKGGLEESAVKKAIIRDAMVTDDANISASKLDINSLFSVINSDNSNTIKSTKVYLDEEGQTLEVAFKEMTTNVTNMGETISSQGTRLSAVEGKIESKIWQQDINTAKNEMSTQYSSLEQEVDGFKIEVSTVSKSIDDVDSKINGRNLIIRSESTQNAYYNQSGTLASNTASGTAAMTSYIAITPNTKYTFSRSTGGGDYFRFNWYDADKNYISRKAITEIIDGGAGSYTWTSPSTAYYILVSYPWDIKSKAMLEIGDSATAWSLAPEDMASEENLSETNTRVTAAESIIEQLSNSISMLVTDGNGTSLMTQTDTGWTFSTAEIQSAANRTSESLNALTNEVGNVDSAVSILQEAVADLGTIAEYVKITTYEDEPCIELGEGDSEFKLRITNTRMMFTEGSNTLAYFNNQSFHVKKAVIEEELQQGGFIWKVRSNGNLGLVWKGVT